MTDESDQRADPRLRLSLARLEVFVATARTGSTRAAAGLVARSQSAASASLAELEGAFGTPLFDRVGRRLVLNEHGRALLPKAVQLLDDAARLESTFTEALPAPLRMAASFTVGEYLLPDLVAGWRKQHPRQPVRLDIGNSTDVARAVAAFDVDIGFVEGGVEHAALRVRRWRRDELVIVAAPGDPLSRGTASVGQLAQAAWVLRERGSGTREAADRWLAARLAPMRIEFELGSSEAVKRIVAAGLGLGCLSRLAVADAVARKRLAEVKTTLPRAARELAIVVHRDRRLGPSAQAFVEHCLGSTTPARSAPARRSRASRLRPTPP
ncbi:MAG: LysR family transcriptional regulator [Caldimonas sp.]